MASKVLIVAGEASGDEYAASLAREIQKRVDNVSIFAIGGKKTATENVTLIENIEKLTVVGLTEVLKHIPQVLKTLRKVKTFIKKNNPDFVILIDYPDFNFKVAKYAFKRKVPVFYFVSPQIWAWRRGRVYFIKKYVNKLFVIFPFEKNFYKSYNINVEFVGHPLTEKIFNFKKVNSVKEKEIGIALLPGSRNSEISKLINVMLEASILIKEKYPYMKFYLPVAPSLDYEKLKEKVAELAPFVEVTFGNSYDVINKSFLVISASGTATLESALFGKPVIIVYKVAPVSYFLGRILVKVPYIGMPNLLLGKCHNPELIQNNATPENIFIETVKFIENKLKYSVTSKKNSLLLDKLHKPDTFSTTAETILKSLPRKK
jgi:lipid-A-disaccharide synthase